MPHSSDSTHELRFYDLFALDMQRVLVDEIRTYFRRLSPVPLNRQRLDELRLWEETHSQKGLYILHYRGVVVYVGKTDISLNERLREHYLKINARQNINVSDITFRCLYLDKNWSALAHEEALIKEYQEVEHCAWNNGGFGLRDPGRRRDHTRLKEAHFDRQYPVNPFIPVRILPGEMTVREILAELKSNLPYLFRFQSVKPPREDYERKLTIPRDQTAEQVMSLIVDVLGSAWQATFLHGYVILYRKHENFDAACAQKFKVGLGQWITPTSIPGRVGENGEEDDDQ